MISALNSRDEKSSSINLPEIKGATTLAIRAYRLAHRDRLAFDAKVTLDLRSQLRQVFLRKTPTQFFNATKRILLCEAFKQLGKNNSAPTNEHFEDAIEAAMLRNIYIENTLMDVFQVLIKKLKKANSASLLDREQYRMRETISAIVAEHSPDHQWLEEEKDRFAELLAKHILMKPRVEDAKSFFHVPTSRYANVTLLFAGNKKVKTFQIFSEDVIPMLNSAIFNPNLGEALRPY